MKTESINQQKQKQVCARCGATFMCGVAAGEASCWCFKLPNVVKVSGAASCHCPACLQSLIAQQDLKTDS